MSKICINDVLPIIIFPTTTSSLLDLITIGVLLDSVRLLVGVDHLTISRLLLVVLLLRDLLVLNLLDVRLLGVVHNGCSRALGVRVVQRLAQLSLSLLSPPADAANHERDDENGADDGEDPPEPDQACDVVIALVAIVVTSTGIVEIVVRIVADALVAAIA